jgi:hypothetical protein
LKKFWIIAGLLIFFSGAAWGTPFNILGVGFASTGDKKIGDVIQINIVLNTTPAFSLLIVSPSTVEGWSLSNLTGSGIAYTAEFTVTDNSTEYASGDSLAIDLNLVDNDGDTASYTASVVLPSGLTIDAKAPTLTSVSIASNNAVNTTAKILDTVTLTFTASEALDIASPSPVTTAVYETSIPTSISLVSGTTYTASRTLAAADRSQLTDGSVISFSITFYDAAGNAGVASVTATTDSSLVTFYGETTWTGTAGTDWSVAANWDEGYVPGPTDAVRIPFTTNKPLLTATSTVKSVSVGIGTRLDTANFDLTVSSGAFTLYGTAELRRYGGSTVSQPTGGKVIYYNGGIVQDYGAADYGNLEFEAGAYTIGADLAVSSALTVAGNTGISGTSHALAADTISSSSTSGLTLEVNSVTTTGAISGIGTLILGTTTNKIASLSTGGAGISAGTVEINTSAAIVLPAINSGGSVTVRTDGNNGSITQSGIITSAGAVSITTNGTASPITLTQNNVVSGSFTASTANQAIEFTNTSAYAMGNISAGSGAVTLTNSGGTVNGSGGIVTANILTLTGTVAFNLTAGNNITTLTTGTPYPASIDFNDTTGGFSIASGGVTTQPGGTVKLTSASGSVTQIGAINTGTLTLSGNSTFTLNNAGNNIATLQTAGSGGTEPYAIDYRDSDDLVIGNITFTPGQTFQVLAGGNITVNGIIQVDGYSSSTTGTVNLYNTSGKNLTFTAPAQVRGIDQLTLRDSGNASLPDSGVINIQSTTLGAISVNGSGANAIVMWAETVNWSGTSGNTNAASGEIHIWVDSTPTNYSYAVAGSKGIHPRTPKHIVYGPFTNVGSLPADLQLLSPDMLIIPSTDLYLGSSVSLITTGNYNIYIVDVGDSSPANARAVTAVVGTNGIIEIRGIYESSGALTLTHGTVGVYLRDGAAITLTGNSFTVSGSLTLYDDASINAVGISVGGNIISSGSAHDLTLNSSSTIGITGYVGTTAARLGDIKIGNTTTPAATFSGAIWANSYTQSAGSATFNSTQNYGGVNTTVYGFEFNGTALAINGGLTTSATANSGVGGKIAVANTGAFNIRAAISSGGAFTQTGAGAVNIRSNITTTNTSPADALIDFTSTVNLDTATTVTLNSSAGSGNIFFRNTTTAISGAGTGRNLTLNAGTSATPLESVITLYGPVSIGGNFTVTANPLTTNSSATPLAITAASFVVNANTNVNPPGTMTVTGATINRGTINAGALATGSNAIVFNGNYNGNNGGGGNVGTINGASTSSSNYAPNPNIVFRNSATVILGIFNHRGDVAVFDGSSGSNHTLSQPASSGAVFANHETPGAVVINAGNTVTLASDIYQDTFPNSAVGTTEDTKSLTLAAGSPGGRLVIGSFNWIMGDTAGPTSGYTPAFTSGFYGYNGELFMDAGSELSTNDFYTEINASLAHEHNVSPVGASTISASGNVYVNETFLNSVSMPLTNSTITMNGTGLIKVRTTGIGAPVELGNLVVDGTTTINSDLIFQGNVTINGTKTLFGGPSSTSAFHIQIFDSLYSSFRFDAGGGPGSWIQNGGFTYQNSVVEFGEGAYSGASRFYKIVGNTTFYDFVCLEAKATLQFSNFPDEHKVEHKFTVFPSSAPYSTAGFYTSRIALQSEMMTITRLTPWPPSVNENPTRNNSRHEIPPISLLPPNPSSTESTEFWSFSLDPLGELEVNWASIYYSYSNRRLPLPPGLDSSWRVDAEPYVEIVTPWSPPSTPAVINTALGVPTNPRPPAAGSGSYYNINWYVGNKFYYGFSEDYNGNGRIDRLRLQSGFELKDKASGAFNGFKVEVWDDDNNYYTVLGYERADTQTLNGSPASAVSKLDCIYVFLEEMPHSDGGKRLNWRVVSNSSLMDQQTGSILISNAGDTNKNVITGYNASWDTVPPRINYALTVPGSGRNEVYFQMSEPVYTNDINSSTGIELDSVDAGFHSTDAKTGSSLRSLDGASQFIFNIYSPYDIEDLSVPDDPLIPSLLPKFRLKNDKIVVGPPGDPDQDYYRVRDGALSATDLRNSGVQYAYRFPPPKYPTNYMYSEYVYVYQKDHENAVSPGVGSILIPNGAISGPLGPLDPPGLPASVISHRVTDALISTPPTKDDGGQYFIWPVFARYLIPSNPGISFPTVSGFYRSTETDTGIIWDFTGRKALEDRDILLQARLNSRLVSAIVPDMNVGHPLLYFGLDVPLPYRYPPVNNSNGKGSGGLWLPPAAQPSEYINLAPLGYKLASQLSAPASGRPHYNFVFSKEYYKSVSRLDFVFRLPGTAPDIYAVRLDMAPGAAIPPNWYSLLRPWSFDIHDVRLQRGGVTILNNVINPEQSEKVQVRYHLVNGGRVTIQVFTLDGNMVKVLFRGWKTQGEYIELWDGKNNSGRSVARGMYFIRVVAPDIDEIRKVMVVK